MPRLQLETKHTYSYGSTVVKFPLTGEEDQTAAFYCVWDSQVFSGQNWGLNEALKTFMPTLPQQGTKHNDRVGNKIHVLSIRYMLTLKLGARLTTLNDGDPFDTTTYSSATNPDAWHNYHGNIGQLPRRWIKCRIMLIKFDKGYTVSPYDFMRLFKSTFLNYRDLPAGVDSNPIFRPVSVHSQVLHMTTEYTGKFNILFDKCVTLYSSNGMYQMDYTVPLNMTYEFDEVNTNTLLSPNLLFVIIPPLDRYVDMDALTRLQYTGAIGRQSYTTAIDMYAIYAACKMNYMDL